MIQLKDRGYMEKRKAILEYTGEAEKDIEFICAQSIKELKSMINGLAVLRAIGFSEEQRNDVMMKVSKEGYVAYKIIRNSFGVPCEVVDLDAARVIPQFEEGQFLWKYINDDNETFTNFAEDSILYLTMTNSFDKIVNRLKTEV